MVNIILIVVAAVIAGVLIAAAMSPNTFQVRRAAMINAPPDRVFPMLEDFYNWGSWSPWEKIDPEMKRTFSGAPRGKGAVYEWDGKKAGAGRMEITDLSSPNRMDIDLRFTKPFKAHNLTQFNLQPQGESTTLTWTMSGARPFGIKVFGLFMNMDEVVGRDFEQGLANIKALVEQ